MNHPEIERMMKNLETMKSEIRALWDAIFALPEEERQVLRIRYTQAYEAYRCYLVLVRERSGLKNQRESSRSSD